MCVFTLNVFIFCFLLCNSTHYCKSCWSQLLLSWDLEFPKFTGQLWIVVWFVHISKLFLAMVCPVTLNYFPHLIPIVHHCLSWSNTVCHSSSLSLMVQHCLPQFIIVSNGPTLSATVQHHLSWSNTVCHSSSLSLMIRHCLPQFIIVSHGPTLSATVRHYLL